MLSGSAGFTSLAGRPLAPRPHRAGPRRRRSRPPTGGATTPVAVAVLGAPTGLACGGPSGSLRLLRPRSSATRPRLSGFGAVACGAGGPPADLMAVVGRSALLSSVGGGPARAMAAVFPGSSMIPWATLERGPWPTAPRVGKPSRLPRPMSPCGRGGGPGGSLPGVRRPPPARDQAGGPRPSSREGVCCQGVLQRGLDPGGQDFPPRGRIRGPGHSYACRQALEEGACRTGAAARVGG